MKKYWTTIMKKYSTTILLSILLLIAIVSVSIDYYDEYIEEDGKQQIVECKDRYGKIIIGLDCIQEPKELINLIPIIAFMLIFGMMAIGAVYMMESIKG